MPLQKALRLVGLLGEGVTGGCQQCGNINGGSGLLEPLHNMTNTMIDDTIRMQM